MSRVKRSITAKKKRRKILKLAKGFFGARSRLLRTATEAVDRAMRYAYRDRRARKREFRQLWIARINAGARANGLLSLKGHKSLGGMRASIYNAMPLAGVQALVDYLHDFEKVRG